MALRADVLSSYALTLSRIAAWAGVSAIVFRRDGAEAFALLALLRGTITLIGYTSLGLGPAMVRLMAEATSPQPPSTPVSNLPRSAQSADQPAPVIASDQDPCPAILAYATPAGLVLPKAEITPQQRVFASGNVLALLLIEAAVLLTLIYAVLVPYIHIIPERLRGTAVLIAISFGFGMAFRIGTEPQSAALQVRGRLAIDNFVLAAAELLWLGLALALSPGWNDPTSPPAIVDVGIFWFFTSLSVAIIRTLARNAIAPDLRRVNRAASSAQMRRLLSFGVTLVIAQLADFLYAPTDYILINRLLTPEDLAAYAPVVQIDGALLLIVGGLATALFPHAALAHAAGDLAWIRKMYVRGTLASAAVLLLAGVGVVLPAPWIFRVWLANDLPAARAILPWVLISTIVGGSSAVGRSILLGMGKVRAFTVSVLIAGGANVVLSVLFATVLGLGLEGIVFGTTVVVVVRCGIWMPWYVSRVLRRGGFSNHVAWNDGARTSNTEVPQEKH